MVVFPPDEQDIKPAGLERDSPAFGGLFEEEGPDSHSLEKMDSLWDRARAEKSEQTGINPNELVRFVHQGTVHWITQEEAHTYLQLADEEDKRQNAIKKEIKRSLRGETQALADELSVLLAIAASSLSRYKREKAIPSEEIRRIEPALQRRFTEVESSLDCLREVERLIEQKRKKEPIFEEYESQLGQMLNLQRYGKSKEAAVLARDLVEKKRRYLIRSRALEPDIYTTYFYRLELQKIKKRILSTQKYLSAQRENNLEEEIEHLKGELVSLQAEKETHEDLMTRGVVLSRVEKEEYQGNLRRIDQTQRLLEDDTAEMESLEKESRILVTQIKNVDEVISFISDEILNESGYEEIIDQRVRWMNAQRNMRRPVKMNLSRRKDSRMVTTSRRQNS